MNNIVIEGKRYQGVFGVQLQKQGNPNRAQSCYYYGLPEHQFFYWVGGCIIMDKSSKQKTFCMIRTKELGCEMCNGRTIDKSFESGLFYKIPKEFWPKNEMKDVVLEDIQQKAKQSSDLIPYVMPEVAEKVWKTP